ncbi:long chain polyunsaturated fatty acid elongation enzyme-like protein [Leishmania infantum JPCM5]|uniref:Elongation of fatty acids protein n=2 Tax=Leishmania infantum TaxID=5671 RepID=A0A6L0XNR3_LEIIN|nr:long chain polyunsaturated fatty acid elongation enzyme-like protein [Leishmania infantum JPCM5]CAC9524249.1 long_chain_polyunsaturated_fatty_acid_elongation_enzyme-like_protein [Leishmania infantum]CAM70869.1 long chain polyunsaturated fatty acid elongation enzyme-like protein [Leishmania infantum JPCM5]SUZ44687.1 long_chain_polyunsaturated_fatty_acid_elongation_enzyme-like_protein [Leishmania infantum]|eukprot:XP_001467802.1 long chain polyunsaturated fatty acid elongation enzyme-like protein [Leishmania infantum JPCM5]
MLSVEQAEQIAAAIEVPDWVLTKSAALVYSCFGTAADAFESSIKINFPAQHAFVEAWMRARSHPFAVRLPYLNPWHGIASILAYLSLIVTLRLLYRVLGKFSCRTLGLVHNLGLHLLSLYMSLGLMISARAAGYSLWNNAAGTSPAEWRIAKLIWLFYVSKVVEWLDTVIMLLKQNYRQVTFLHVYHHTTVFVLWWLASLVAPGGESYYSAMVNSGVHVFMYGYYFFTLLFPSGIVRDVLSKFKFVITKGQMWQFVFNCLQSTYDLVWVPREELKYSAVLLQILFWYMISLLALFGNFLVKNKNFSHRRRVDAATGSGAKEDTAGRSYGDRTHGTRVKVGITNMQLETLKNEKVAELKRLMHKNGNGNGQKASLEATAGSR